MDANSSHITTTTTAAPHRSSRSSQSPSPSHSASASATSSLHKRKLSAPEDHAPPFSDNTDDLDSITARAAPDSDDSDEFEDVVDDDEDEFDDTSIRNFTSSRLENNNNNNTNNNNTNTNNNNSNNATTNNSNNGNGNSNVVQTVRNTKMKVENAVGGEGGSTQTVTVSVSTPGTGVVKEDNNVKSIFTENLQTSGAYCGREESLKREEEAGTLKFVCVSNDKIDQHMIWLIGLKNIFARQLPNMPKEYIVRLVMDRGHKSVMVIRHNTVVGGITYRPYVSQKFGEIAFCAITSDEQVKGYGTRLMNHLKQHARDVDGLTHFLTYADNNAVGYFNKQGFTKNINLERERWHGYIKDYDGGILMECKIDPKLPYTDLSTMIHRQRQAIDEKIRELSNCHIVYPGIDFLKKEAGIPKRVCKLEDIPGLRSAGWTPDQYGHSRFKYLNASPDGTINQKLTGFMRSILKALHDHADAWPFKEPVDVRDVPDYYDIIRDPMDLKTMSKRVESEQYYVTLEMFIADARRMFANARTYNSPETIYFKCSTRLETFFSSRVQSGVQSFLKS